MTNTINTPSDFRLPGCRTRLLVELRTSDWPRLLSLLQWIQERQGHIEFSHTQAQAGGATQVNLGLERVDAGALRWQLNASEAFEGVRIEHFHMRG